MGVVLGGCEWSWPLALHVMLQVLGCVVHVLQTDLEPSVRQAALLVLKLLIKGLSQDAIQVTLTMGGIC